MKDNLIKNKFHWLYLAGLSIILFLPILTIPPYFSPADWGKSIIFRSIMAIMLFLFLWQIIYKKSTILLPDLKNYTSKSIMYALAGLFLVFALATIFSVDPYFSLWGNPIRSGGFITFSFYFIFAILSFILFKKEDWKKAFDFSIIIGILVSLIAIAQYYGLFQKTLLVAGRPPSTMGNPIILGIYLLLLVFIALSFALKEIKLPKKIFYYFSVLLFICTILISGSRAAYLGLLIGGLFFVLLYPKKMLAVKTATIVCLALGILAVFYINSTPNIPKFLESNKIFQAIQPRLSLKLALADPRFYAWSGIDTKILLEKPILGYGPENFSVGFDKHYDPSLPYLSQDWGNWWDRAHNIIFDVGSQAGIPGIIAYLTLFTVLLWQLQKAKKKTENSSELMIMHGIQATLIGYFIANIFSFDTFSTCIIFFLLIGYSLHLASNNNDAGKEFHDIKYKTPITAVMLIILAIFLWQYNFMPFVINAEINKASNLAKQKYCGQALGSMDKTLLKHSFLDSYSRMEYVEFTKTCADFFPENTLTYLKTDFELIKDAAKKQPLYTRYWILLGSSANTLAMQEKDTAIRSDLLKQANNYLATASKLAPKHKEIIIEQAKTEMLLENYENMMGYYEKCITLDPSQGDCYWRRAISEIYLNDAPSAQKDIKTAFEKGYGIDSKVSLGELSDAYGSISDYKNLVPVYVKLIEIEPNNAQYHSSLAFFFKEIKQYADARKEALKVLQLSPESKPNVDAFLKTLPY